MPALKKLNGFNMVRLGLASTKTTQIWQSAAYKKGWVPKSVEELERQANDLFNALKRGPTGAYFAIEQVLGKRRAIEVYRGHAIPPTEVLEAAQISRKRTMRRSIEEVVVISDEEVEELEMMSHERAKRRRLA